MIVRLRWSLCICVAAAVAAAGVVGEVVVVASSFLRRFSGYSYLSIRWVICRCTAVISISSVRCFLWSFRYCGSFAFVTSL